MADYPFVPTDGSADPSQFTDQSSPDTGISFPDFSGGVPLSGDSSVPSQSQGQNISLPFAPTGGSTGPQSYIGMHVKDIVGTQNVMNGGTTPSYVGMHVNDILNPKPPTRQLPKPAPSIAPGRPKPNYGNDLAGSVLQKEGELPDWGQAFVHGAQSQVLPGAAALGGGIAAGAALGSVVPVVGTVIGGVVGGLIGYWIGSQAQDAVTQSLVPEQTRKAYEAQSQYEQQNYPLQYGLGELFPQVLAFKPNPKAIAGAFRLAGRVTAAPMAEKWAILKGPDIADRLAYQDHQDVLNQLMMMAYGTGYTAIQAKQQFDAGDVQPVLLAVNLLGTTLLSKPRWMKDVAPEARPGIDEATAANAQNYVNGMTDNVPPDQLPHAQAKAQAFQDLNDANLSGDQAKIAEAQARMDALIQEENQAPAQAAPEVGIPPRTPDVISEELINEVDAARTPEEKLRVAQEVDDIAARQRIPNWESQVARVQAEEQARTGTLAQQTNAVRGGVQQFQNAPYERNPVVTGPEHQAGLQAAIDKFGLRRPTPAEQSGRKLTPEEAQAFINNNPPEFLDKMHSQLKPLFGVEPTPEQEAQALTAAQEHAKANMRQLRTPEPLEEAYPLQGQMQQQAETGPSKAQSAKYLKAAKAVNLSSSARFDPDFASESRNFEQSGPPNGFITAEEKKFPMGLNPKDRVPYTVKNIGIYDGNGSLAGTFSIATESKNPSYRGAFKITTRPDLERQGYATALLNEAERQGIDLVKIAGKNSYTHQGRQLLQKYFKNKAQGEENGIQQETAGIPQEAGQVSSQANEIPGQTPGEIGQQVGIPSNSAEAINAPGSIEGGIGNAEAGADGTPTTGAGIIRPDAGIESGPDGAAITDATGATTNEPNAATATGNAEAIVNPTGSSAATERDTAYGEQPEAGNAGTGPIGRGPNPAATDPTVVKATADSLRAHLKQPGYVAMPEETTALSALDGKTREMTQAANPRPWPTSDPRLPNKVDKNLLNKTFNAVTQTPLIEGEGGRAYADRMVKASGVYKNLDHVLEIAQAARSGFFEPVTTPDGKVGFKIDGKLYKDTPSYHAANWDNGWDGVINSILDNSPNELFAGEPASQPPIPLDAQQLRMSFADEYHPQTTNVPTPPAEPAPVPSFRPHDFVMSAHAADTPTLELGSANAVNKIKAGISQVQQNLDTVEDLADQGVFPVEPIQKKFEQLEEAAGGGSGLPPRPPTGGGEGGGEEPPPNGRTPGDRKAAALEAQYAKTQKLENDYYDALKKGMLIDDPIQKRIHAGINDILSSAMRTFDINQWQKHPRILAADASRAAKAFGTYYQKIAGDMKLKIGDFEKQSPGAEKRIRDYYTADEASKPSHLEQMSAEERAFAEHTHTYWQLLGDVLERAHVIKSALEDYFPLITDKNVWASGEQYGKGNVVSHNGRLYVAKNDIEKATRSPISDTLNWAAKPETQRLAAKSKHSIARLLDKEDGSLLFRTPEELQAWADDKGLGWKVKTDIGDVFQAQGASVIKALVMKHTVDQMMLNEFQINKFGESAPAILTDKQMHDHIVALDNSDQFVKGSTVIGPWASALTRPKWLGSQRVPEDLWVRKDLAEQMSREASFEELGDNPMVRLFRWLSNVNNYWKVFKFALTPMHAYSMLSNVTTHTGLNPAGAYGVVRRGADITNNPAFRHRFFQLQKASGATEPVGEALGGPHSVLNNLPGIGKFFKLQEHLMWKTVGYNALYGLGDKLSREFLTSMALKGEPVTQFEADKFGMDAAKKAIGYLDQLDMSKNYNLGANVLLLANRWTTGQMRTMGEAFGLKYLAKLGNPIPVEGSSARATKFMQDRQIEMSRRLVMGGMLRLFMTATALSTAVSALLNNGIPSTPWDNYQKDPAHTFDIYSGRDPVTNRDNWVHMPFYLFQREMVDWAMAAVKAQEQGKEFIDINNYGDSVLAAPFVRFASKMNPVTKTSLEVATGQEIGQWMKGYDKAGIDSDQYIVNLNKSLQKLNIPDGGSLENRLLYAMRNLLPGVNYPENLPQATADPMAVANAIAGIPFGGSPTHPELGFLGLRIDEGTRFTMGQDGQMVPTWQVNQQKDQKAQIGQQILTLASTLGTGPAEDETKKFEQMEGLRQQGGFTPGQLVQLLLYGAGHNTGGQGLLYQDLPPKTPEDMKPQGVVIDGRKLTPQEEVSYQSVKFQREAFSIAQLMGDPSWKTTSLDDRSYNVNNIKDFADRITNREFGVALGTQKGTSITSAQGLQMLTAYNQLSKYTQANLRTTAQFSAATPEDQQSMLADRASATQTAVWDKYFQTGILKNASNSQMLAYVEVHSGVRDEVRQLVRTLPSYTTSMNPLAQNAMMASGLAFADNLVNQAASGQTLKTFDSPLNQQQLTLAVKNGVVLQDAAVRELHNSFIYQEASDTDQALLDQKYTNLAHNVALADMRKGVTSLPGSERGFDATLRTTLAGDEGYQSLVEQYFGVGGIHALKAKEAELDDLKKRFRQEYAIKPADLSKYNTMIIRWYEQQNPDYAEFKKARTWWEKNDPTGQAYRASSQSNLGFESTDPLALSTAPA